ncbi:TrmH family RNA methyltransferase [Ferruginibacter albus]|uniref:TrmH family RNA methyltransferase n=1 Tax=Ferruginibacter albus TaxID=2875540 RepID=UPI001CC3EB74|nr:RNA methyltransferase [Ferruginibacter albus]UAY53289.1 RNA methyltransferase [Ferruginibacter albus]
MFSKSHIKYIQSLHHKKFRDEEGVFIAEGEKIVKELLSSNLHCKEIVALPEWFNANEKLVSTVTAVLHEVKDFELEKISALSTANQVLAIFEKKVVEAVTLTGKITLVLDDIQDPGNMGTIIRIADWFGITSIICSKNSADIYSPKVIQSTMGSIARINIMYDDLQTWLPQNKKVKVYAAALNGKPVSTLKDTEEAIIIIGNESKGISNEVMELVDEKITIPRIGNAESLNAAVATGIILSHII